MLKSGWWVAGEFQETYRAIAANGDICELAAVADLIRRKWMRQLLYNEKQAKMSEVQGLPEMLQEEIDIISLPPKAVHAQHALASLQAGKHVLVEKPMALSISDCDKMIAAAEERD